MYLSLLRLLQRKQHLTRGAVHAVETRAKHIDDGVASGRLHPLHRTGKQRPAARCCGVPQLVGVQGEGRRREVLAFGSGEILKCSGAMATARAACYRAAHADMLHAFRHSVAGSLFQARHVRTAYTGVDVVSGRAPLHPQQPRQQRDEQRGQRTVQADRQTGEGA